MLLFVPPICCASFLCFFLWGLLRWASGFLGLALGASLVRLVGSCLFESASSSKRIFIPPCIVCLALFWAGWIRFCLSGIAAPWMLSHISDILTSPVFSGHVHVDRVYWFSRIPRRITKWVGVEYLSPQ